MYELAWGKCLDMHHLMACKCKVLPVGAFVEGELHLVINAIVS
jgi:hypothetical protein